MIKKEKELTLAEIRTAQAEISVEMARESLSKAGRTELEKASLSLRNLERALVQTEEQELAATLKKENESLKELTKLMVRKSDQLFRINGLLREIVRKTGRVIDILGLVR